MANWSLCRHVGGHAVELVGEVSRRNYGRIRPGSYVCIDNRDVTQLPRCLERTDHPAVLDPSVPLPQACERREACRHRGRQFATRLSAGCRTSAFEVPLYACELHGQCADHVVRQSDTSRRDDLVRWCVTCGDYVTLQPTI